MGALFGGAGQQDSVSTYTRTATDHCICMWLRLDDNSVGRRPFGTNGGWESRIAAGSTTLISDYLQSGTSNEVDLVLGQWHHVVFVNNITAGSGQAYLDGVLVSDLPSITYTAGQTDVVRIGATGGNLAQKWFGAIDDIRVYDRILEVAEIETIYHTYGLDGIYDMSLWYQLNEGVEGGFSTVFEETVEGVLDCDVITGAPRYDYTNSITYQRFD